MKGAREPLVAKGSWQEGPPKEGGGIKDDLLIHSDRGPFMFRVRHFLKGDVIQALKSLGLVWICQQSQQKQHSLCSNKVGLSNLLPTRG